MLEVMSKDDELKWRLSKEVNDTEKSIEGMLTSLATFLIGANGFFFTTDNFKILVMWQKIVLLICIILLGTSLVLGVVHLLKVLNMHEKSLKNWAKSHNVDRWPYFNLQILSLGLVLSMYIALIITLLFRKV